MFPHLLLLIQLLFVVAEGVLVKTPNGKILGRKDRTIKNNTFYAFERVPYASPPVGPLRFMPPEPHQKWKGIFNNTPVEVACFQLGIIPPYPYPESEDCLYLNVFTPRLPNTNLGALPVMLFIPGGGFIQGTAFQVPPDLFIDNDVILVTINYRLGVFGFLSTQDNVILGNNGLKDQQLAIQWTHENIKLFGGDPEKITIFGQSAGSVSVAYQLLNKKSKGLFRGAILQSGSFLCPWAIQRSARTHAFEIGSIFNSTFRTNRNSKVLLKVLQAVNAIVLNAAVVERYPELLQPTQLALGVEIPFAPVIEVENPQAFLTRKMYQLLKAGNVIPVPVLLGLVSEEILSFVQDPIILINLLQTLDDHLDLTVPKDMQLTNLTKAQDMGKKIRNIYTGESPFVDRLGDGVRFASDTLFTRPIIKHAELYSRFAKTYLYQFSYHGVLGGNTRQYDGADSVGHAEELPYLFCSKEGCDFSGLPEVDQLVQKRLIKIWTNFAKHLNPTPEKSELLQNITWPEVNAKKGNLLYVDINGTLQIKNHPKKPTYSRWVELYDSLGRDDFDTY